MLTTNRGNNSDTKGTAYVVYEDIFDAKNAVEHLNGFNVKNRYLIVAYHQQARVLRKMDSEKRQKELEKLRKATGVKLDDKTEK